MVQMLAMSMGVATAGGVLAAWGLLRWRPPASSGSLNFQFSIFIIILL